MSGGAEVTGRARLAGEFRPLGSPGSATDGARVVAKCGSARACSLPPIEQPATSHCIRNAPATTPAGSMVASVVCAARAGLGGSCGAALGVPDPSGPQPVFRRCHAVESCRGRDLHDQLARPQGSPRGRVLRARARVLRDWVVYAGRRRGVPAAAVDQAVAAANFFRQAMLDAVSDPESWGQRKRSRSPRRRPESI